MFSYDQLALPVVGAPMAGGPTTPELVAAVSNAGGLGMLAAGYYSPEQIEADVLAVRALTDKPFGVNLFSPTEPDENPEDAEALLQQYREALAPVGEQFGLDLLNYELDIPDYYQANVDWLVENPVPVVTFTFGCPTIETIKRLQNVGTFVGVTVTKVADAEFSVSRGVDFLAVQGPEAGGHQSTFRVQDSVNELALDELVPAIQQVCELPLVVGGGVGNSNDVARLLRLGAVAVQIGTLLLLCEEAGTNEAYRKALQNPAYSETRITRAFTGRPARALVNDFVDRFDNIAPAIYPHPHYLTAPLRASAKKAEYESLINLWSGTGLKNPKETSIIEIMSRLFYTKSNRDEK
ncbi:nitronate monooxygenase [uncultured Rothia sp.]|uniref:nitronate monooxygenase n=1 Tax=uncultured Rothia sp. TaxID=316088 RepID=UPI0032164987